MNKTEFKDISINIMLGEEYLKIKLSKKIDGKWIHLKDIVITEFLDVKTYNIKENEKEN